MFIKKMRRSKREKFLETMHRVPRPFPLETILRIHLMRQGFGTSGPAMEDALYEVPLLRAFAGLDASDDTMPDETTIGRSDRMFSLLGPPAVV